MGFLNIFRRGRAKEFSTTQVGRRSLEPQTRTSEQHDDRRRPVVVPSKADAAPSAHTGLPLETETDPIPSQLSNTPKFTIAQSPISVAPPATVAPFSGTQAGPEKLKTIRTSRQPEMEVVTEESKTSEQHNVQQLLCEKRLIIYTSIEDRKTKLRSRVQVVLTLTPAWCSTETKRIAWKVIDFVPNLDIQKKVGLPPGTSISTLSQGHDDVNIAHDFFPLTPNTCISLQTDDGNAFWEEDDSQVVDDNLFRVRNNPIPKKLALCVHDDDEDKSDPVVFLGESSDIKTGPPVMLEAYVVSHFKEGQIVDLEGRQSIIIESDRRGVAVDLNRKDEFIFHLYCESGGRPVLRVKNI